MAVKWRVAAIAAALIAAVAAPRAQQVVNPDTPWKIGDVFVNVGDTAGVYRTFNADATPKGEADLTDIAQFFGSGCAVDTSVSDGDLFTTSWWTPVSRFSNSVPHTLLTALSFDVATAPSLTSPLPAEFLTPSDPNQYPVIESIVFDRAGDMYLGAQVPPTDANTWLGHGWIIKMSKDGTILNWWQVDAGSAHVGVSQDVHGVDWMDLSNDETTIYYISEDQYIRSFNVVTGQQGPEIPLLRKDGNPPTSKAFALRILPPGDPANGFLVATTYAVLRVDGSGHEVTSYQVPGDTGYFALNITPDGQYVWTATTHPDDPTQQARIYKFHIASGELVASSDIGNTTTAWGLCVKREYTASQNVCFASDLSGAPIPDANDPTGFKTITCQLPPTPEQCAQDPSTAGCGQPGAPTLSLADQTNYEGDSVSLQLSASDPSNLPLTFTVKGLPPAMCPNTTVDSCGTLISQASGVISGQLSWISANDPNPGLYTVGVTVTNTNGLSASGTFLWTVLPKNGPPHLDNPGDQVYTVGAPVTLSLTVRDPDAATDVVALSATGLPAGLSLTNQTSSYGNGWPAGISGTAAPGGVYIVTVSACDCGSPGSHTTVSQTFKVTINAPPALNVTNQTTLVGQPATYAIAASSADGNGLSYSITGLPAGLTYDHTTGVISGTPTTPVDAVPVTVTVTDLGNTLTATKTFTWRVIAPPLLTLANQVSLVNTPASYQVPAASRPAGHALSYAITGLPDGLHADSTTGLISGTPTMPVNAAPVSVTVTDTVNGLSTPGSFTWTVITNRPPDCTAAVASPVLLWPPNHKFVNVAINGVVDPDGDPMAILITSITQDQPSNITGDGNTVFDGLGVGTGQASVRAERTGNLSIPDDGRLYQINFTATDTHGASCSGAVFTGVPHDQGQHNLPSDNLCRWNSVTGQQIGACAWWPPSVNGRSNHGGDEGSAGDDEHERSGDDSHSGSAGDGRDGSGGDSHYGGGQQDECERKGGPQVSQPEDHSSREGDKCDERIKGSDPLNHQLHYTASSLPPGLAMSDDGRISGRIASGAHGTYNVTVKASDGHNTCSRTFSWRVSR